MTSSIARELGTSLPSAMEPVAMQGAGATLRTSVLPFATEGIATLGPRTEKPIVMETTVLLSSSGETPSARASCVKPSS